MDDDNAELVETVDDGEDLTAEADAAHAEALTIRDAAIAEHVATITNLTAQLQRVQAHNYELLMAVAGSEVESNESEEIDTTADSDADLDDAWTVKESK